MFDWYPGKFLLGGGVERQITEDEINIEEGDILQGVHVRILQLSPKYLFVYIKKDGKDIWKISVPARGWARVMGEDALKHAREPGFPTF